MTLYERIRRVATPPVIATAIVAYIASVIALEIADTPLREIAPGVTKPDLIVGYGTADLVAIFDAWGAEGRRAYAVSTAVDSVMPILAAIATLLVVARLTERWFWPLAIGPLVFAATDLAENALFGALLLTYPEFPDAIVVPASLITPVKLGAFWLVTLPTLIAGGLVLGARGLIRTVGPSWR